PPGFPVSHRRRSEVTEAGFPRAARRFESVGFSEIVKVRNRVLELLAAGHKVWRFEGGEPYMPTPQPIKDAMTEALAKNETRYAPETSNTQDQASLLELADEPDRRCLFARRVRGDLRVHPRPGARVDFRRGLRGPDL